MTITPEELVRREVAYCASGLIYTICGATGEVQWPGGLGDFGNLVEQAVELSAPIIDWEETARNDGWQRVEQDPDPDQTGCGPEGPCLFHEATARVWPLGDWQGAAEDTDAEPVEREVFEHWIVTDWLADKLEARGEKVDKDFAGLTIWARTTTGQAIYLDPVIEDICADLNRPLEA